MILQLLTSEFLKLEDPSHEVVAEEAKLAAIVEPSTLEDLKMLSGIVRKKFQYETSLQTRVNLQNLETLLIKANHFTSATDEVEDFV